jgi:hypothetical protein
MNTPTVLGLLALGAAGGFPLGRWWAEAARARHDIARIWHSRTHYRRRRR